ncbi:MAG: 2-amino-4-hydroxy-6-hydroxymethyldihydropteridine diphosphokinase [Deltaproteobacteria bacterium]|nr:2-amino-4-hydroxy-6-hydroxymethyldihydropteridine diphosphokinase [Deltaproteobacteria bacterium]
MQNSKYSSAFISIGSNIGDKTDFCKKGIDGIDNLQGCRITDISKFYQTSPVDYTEQDSFANCAVKIKTEYSPEVLLDNLRKIEKKVGTVEKKVRFGPRILDLDIIFYDDIILDTDRLKIPHPRMHTRYFVLLPIADIDSDFIHPALKISIKSLIENLKKDIRYNQQKARIIT